jgi:hypothetical protein
MIHLDHCTVEWTDAGARTVFRDGTETHAYPHYDDPHYVVIAHRCGYGDDLLAYCREHELAHSFLLQELRGIASHVLEGQAHDRIVRSGVAVPEEMSVQMFQRWCRANERPIVAGCDWDDLKQRFLQYADAEGHDYEQLTRASASHPGCAPEEAIIHVHE